jgi:hypothetical protein
MDMRETEPERMLRKALEEIETLRTGDCPDAAMIGAFAENRLSGEEKQRLETHICACLY